MHKILFAGIAIGAALTQHAFAADAVLTWNANAGVAATKACLAPDDNPFHESAHLCDDAHRRSTTR